MLTLTWIALEKTNRAIKIECVPNVYLYKLLLIVLAFLTRKIGHHFRAMTSDVNKRAIKYVVFSQFPGIHHCVFQTLFSLYLLNSTGKHSLRIQ